MDILHIISAILPSTCQKLLQLMEIRQSSERNNFAQFFLRHRVYMVISKDIFPQSMRHFVVGLTNRSSKKGISLTKL